MKQEIGWNWSAKGSKRNEKLQPKHMEVWQLGAFGHFLCLRPATTADSNDELKSFKSSFSSSTASSNLGLFSTKSF
jgi:hypothetical protein